MGLLRPKAKGDKYEREVAKYLDEILYDEEFQKILRAPLSGGGRSFQGGGSADITGTPDIWVEAKLRLPSVHPRCLPYLVDETEWKQKKV